MNKKEEKKIKKNGNIINKIIESYSNIKPMWKKIIKIWAIVLIVIILLIIVCSCNNRVVSNHTSMEKAINKAALEYVNDKELYATVDKKLRISIDELISEGYLKKKSITDDTCTGYALVYQENDKDNVSSYLLCKGYTTEGYSVK